MLIHVDVVFLGFQTPFDGIEQLTAIDRITVMAHEEDCGFTLYVQNLRHRMGGRNALGGWAFEAALPGWHKLEQHEQQIWRNRARELQRSHWEHRTRQCERQAQNWNRDNWQRKNTHVPKMDHKQALAAIKKDLNSGDCYDSDEADEFEIGTPDIQPNGDGDEASIAKMLEEKYEKDRKRVVEMILTKTDGCVDKMKSIRFLMISAQTYGLVDGICLLAEVALTEFDLADGILETFGTVVGPWNMPNQVQRSRAMFHSRETHNIPLDSMPHIDKASLLMELLGRYEPQVACAQGVAVGLYRNTPVNGEQAFSFLEHSPRRRVLLCLSHEFCEIKASLAHLKQTVNLNYEGFPETDDDYILADAFVDAMCEVLGGEALKDYRGWLKALGTPVSPDFTTPWERGSELFCAQHRPSRNSCCAQVTAARAAYIILYTLEKLIK